MKSRGSADRHTQRIFEHTKGILFIGSPHCGSGLADLAIIGSRLLQSFRRVNRETLEILQQKSEVMARIRQDFHTMLRGRDQSTDGGIAIVCFYEELPVRAIGEVLLSRMIRKCLVADPRKIVPKHSACLDRYTSIGIHADHMGMTRFSSDQDPDYQNVLSELRRFVQPYKQQMGTMLPLATSVSPDLHGKSYHRTENKSSSTMERDQNTVRVEEKPYQPARSSINTFSGTFDTSGGKMIQGSEFNSGGGSMTF